jgi:hypothetical protein
VNAEVERLKTGAAGGASTGLKVNRDGSHEIYAGDIVVLATGAARLWVPRSSSTSRDQAVFVDQATDASLSSDPVLCEIDRFG